MKKIIKVVIFVLLGLVCIHLIVMGVIILIQ